MVGATRAQHTAERRTRSAPDRYADRGPSRVSSALTVVAATTEATRYTVVTQAYSR